MAMGFKILKEDFQMKVMFKTKISKRLGPLWDNVQVFENTNETKLVGIPHAPPPTTITIPTYVSTPYYYITCFQNHLSINMISLCNDNDTFSWYISIPSFHLFQSVLSWMSFFCLDVN